MVSTVCGKVAKLLDPALVSKINAVIHCKEYGKPLPPRYLYKICDK